MGLPSPHKTDRCHPTIKKSHSDYCHSRHLILISLVFFLNWGVWSKFHWVAIAIKLIEAPQTSKKQSDQDHFNYDFSSFLGWLKQMSWGCHHHKTDRSPPTIKNLIQTTVIPGHLNSDFSSVLTWVIFFWSNIMRLPSTKWYLLTALHPKSHNNVCGCCGGCGGAVAATTPVQRRAGAIGMLQGWHLGLAGKC